MKLSSKALSYTAIASVVLVLGTGVTHAQKGGGSRGGSSGGGAARMGGNSGGSKFNSQSMGGGKSFQNHGMPKQTAQKVSDPRVTTPSLGNKVGNSKPMANGNMAKNLGPGFKKPGFAKGEPHPSAPGGFKFPSQHHNKNNFFCGTPYYGKGYCGFPSNWNNGCWNSWNHCHFNHCHSVGWNNWWNYPCYPSYCSTPCYTTYPVYDYCYSTPVVYYQQAPIVTKTIVEQVAVQPPPVVETVTQTTMTAQASAQELNFLTSSALRP